MLNLTVTATFAIILFAMCLYIHRLRTRLHAANNDLSAARQTPAEIHRPGLPRSGGLGVIGSLFLQAGIKLSSDSTRVDASMDLQALGEELIVCAGTWEIQERIASDAFQQLMCRLGEKYGIEPVAGGSFCLPQAFMIGNEIVASALLSNGDAGMRAAEQVQDAVTVARAPTTLSLAA